MDVPLRVTIQQRDYGLRVKSGAEADTQALVRALDERIGAFRRAFPMQPELTAVVMTALALAEELQQLRAQVRDAGARREDVDAHLAAVEAYYTNALADLGDVLEDGLHGEPADASGPDEPDGDARHDDHAEGDGQDEAPTVNPESGSHDTGFSEA